MGDPHKGWLGEDRDGNQSSHASVDRRGKVKCTRRMSGSGDGDKDDDEDG